MSMSLFIGQYSVASSAIKNIFELTEVGIEIMYIKNKFGLRTGPRGIPLYTVFYYDFKSFITTICRFFDKKP